jgi:hypothetical protein
LERNWGVFGKPRPVGQFSPVVPLSVDAIGEVWAGFLGDGPETGRLVLATIARHQTRPPFLGPILRSAQDALQMRHPNVLDFLDVAVDDGATALVSEYIDGEPLSRLQAASAQLSAPVLPRVALSIVRQATSTLSDLRQRHPDCFSHGALCPETIFVTRLGETLLRQPAVHCAAVHISDLRSHPAALPYLAPEYLIDNRENEESADVFSAGVILWELIAGRSLFGRIDHTRKDNLTRLSGTEILETEKRIGSMRIPSLAQMDCPGGAMHPDVVRLVEWALERGPSRRPQTLADFNRAISALSPQLVAGPMEVADAVESLVGSTVGSRAERLRRPSVLRENATSPLKKLAPRLSNSEESVSLGRIPLRRRTASISKPFMETAPLSEPFMETAPFSEPFVETPRTLSEPSRMDAADLPSVVPYPVECNLLELDPPEFGMASPQEDVIIPRGKSPAFAELTPVSVYGVTSVPAARQRRSRPANRAAQKGWLLAAAALLLGGAFASALLHLLEEQSSPAVTAETRPATGSRGSPAETAPDPSPRQLDSKGTSVPAGVRDIRLENKDGKHRPEAAPAPTAPQRHKPEPKPTLQPNAEGPYRPSGI